MGETVLQSAFNAFRTDLLARIEANELQVNDVRSSLLEIILPCLSEQGITWETVESTPGLVTTLDTLIERFMARVRELGQQTTLLPDTPQATQDEDAPM